MSALFAYVLEMSFAGSIAAFAVLLFRWVLRKAPKWISSALWALVAFRLLIPISFESPLSFTPPQKETIHNHIQESFGSGDANAGSFWIDPNTELTPQEHSVEATPQKQEEQKVMQKSSASFRDLIPFLWICGVGIMLSTSLISYFRLKIRLSSSVPYAKGIRQSEQVRSPFILGALRPVIYLPFQLDEWTTLSVLAHERAHIKRGDHLIKPFGWLLLSIHWFNPLLWLSYALLCRDIESACDEKVLAEMNEEERRDYARALLKCSTRSVGVYACPLAFGEQNVKGRIKMTLSYKKPVFWVIVLSLIIAGIATVGILSDPVMKYSKTETGKDSEKAVSADQILSEDDDWWGEMEDFEIQANAKNAVFKFQFNQEVFKDKAINKENKDWSDPIMVAENKDQLLEILEGCLTNPLENRNLIGRVNQYFDEKAKEFNKIYPMLEAPDFFESHVIMVVFSRPQDERVYVERAMLEETEDQNLKVVLDMAYLFEKERYLYTERVDGTVQESVGIDDGGSLKFYWISRDAWNKFDNGKIEYFPTTQFRPEWIHYNTFTYQPDQGKESYYVMLRRNDYDEYPLVAGVEFGTAYLEESRERYAAFHYPEGNWEQERVKYLQVQSATFSYPATEEGNCLTINQCSFRGGKILASHVFIMENGRLIYDESSSPDKIPGLPDGAVFTLKEPNY